MEILKISTIWQLVEKIENIRYIVKILFEAMEIEDDKEKSRKLFSSRIPNDEYQELRNNLNPESIKAILLKRKDNIIYQGGTKNQFIMRYSKMRYSLTEVNIDDKHMERLKSAIENNKAAMIRIFLKEPRESTLLLTKGQVLKIQQGEMLGKDSISYLCLR